MKIQSLLFLLLLMAACTPAQTPAPALPTSTLTAIPPATFTPAPTATELSTPDIAATQRSEDFHVWIERLVGMGILPDDHGQYMAFDDISPAYSDEHSLHLMPMNLKARDLVLQARVKIESAAKGQSKAGCGFTFLVHEDHSMAMLLAQDGNVNLVVDGYPAKSNYLNPDVPDAPQGNLITLVVLDYGVHFFVNNDMVLEAKNIVQILPNEKPTGGFGPALLSGTNEGFGTRCEFTEFSGWVIH